MTALIMRLRRFVTAFQDDTSGIILPYVTMMLVVFVGLGALALDGGRFMSMQTQMQGVADALSIAGARELDQKSGARSRATSAINNLVSNGLTGLGYSGAITPAAPVFYSALGVATAGFTAGTPATSDQDAKFVAVTVDPVTVPTIMPISFFKSGATNNFSTGARAIAGFKNRAVCGISPVFICNPYETSGMSDSQATAALYAALDPNDPSYNAATRRKLFRMPVVGNNSSPGHFGWLQQVNNSDGCNPNNTPCLSKLIAYDSKASLSRSCFDGSGVVFATGNKPVPDAFNDRFDIYSGNGPSADFTPSINVRKGYIKGSNNSWCTGGKNGAKPGHYLSAQAAALPANLTVPLVVNTTNTAAVNTSPTFVVASATNLSVGMSIVKTATPNVLLSTVTGISGTQITVGQKVTLAANTPLNFTWLTAPFPLDKQWTGLCSGGTCVQGNADWDCLNYWKINHPAAHAPPAGCTASNPTVSRYDVYTAENSQAGNNPAAQPPAAANDINDWSGIPPGVPNAASTETGAPMCAINSGFTPTFDSTYDPRMVHVAVINCAAQTALGNIGGGNAGPPTPTAGFAKYFLTQPYGVDSSTYLYGEMAGLVNSLDQVRIMNQVQLYR